MRTSIRSTIASTLAAATIAAGITAYAPDAEATKLEIATLAPKRSAWGKVFSAWSKALKKRTGGKLELEFYYGGSQGGAVAVVNKLRSGQLDGATLGAYGLALMHQDALALQIPGLFRSWEGIDRATKAVYPEFAKAFDDKGFVLSSIGDVGRARTFSKGKAIRTPADLKGMKPFSPIKGIISPKLSEVLDLRPVRKTIPEILPGLSGGTINVITVPAIAAEQLQWAPYLDHVGDDVLGIAVGAMVFRKERVAGMPNDVIAQMTKTGKKAGKLLRKRVRKMDDRAYKRLKRRMTVVKLTEGERRQWADVFAKLRANLKQGTFTPALVTKLEGLADPM